MKLIIFGSYKFYVYLLKIRNKTSSPEDFELTRLDFMIIGQSHKQLGDHDFQNHQH